MMKHMSSYDYLTSGECFDFSNHTLLIIATAEDGCRLNIQYGKDVACCNIESHQQGLFVTTPARIEVAHGWLKFYQFDFMRLVKLQVFIDKAQKLVSGQRKNSQWGYQAAVFGSEPAFRDIEYWLLSQTMSTASDTTNISSVLRNNEWYDLICFLLEESNGNSNQRLQVLCARYGLSASHFRRLSKHALGNTTKVEMRDWRLVRALLELIDGESNFTTIAMNQGYASLSHFSNEVKDVLGISPRNLKKSLNVGQE